MKSLSEISVIEKAHSYGSATLGDAASALLERWTNGLTDNETFIRLAFYRWYSMSEPNWYNGLPDNSSDLPDIDALVSVLGGYESLPAESLFILGALATGYPWCLGAEDIWKERAITFPSRASELEPQSRVFQNWRFILLKETNNSDLRKHIKSEFHARFHGRGYMGEYLESVFGRNI